MSSANLLGKDEKKDDHGHVYPSSADAYDVLEEIGQGAFASVYRAVVKTTGEEVAVKVMNLDEFNLNWDDVSREIHTMCQLHHPNVVRFLCSFADGADLWVVMPLLEAGSCAAIMKTLQPNGFKDEVLIATILKESLKGLEYLHKHNYIHRDIKCWATGTKLMLYNGTYKNVENIKEGDLLMGEDSKPKIVLPNSVNTYTNQQLFRIIPEEESGRDSWLCNVEHILMLKCTGQPAVRQLEENNFAIQFFELCRSMETSSDSQCHILLEKFLPEKFDCANAAQNFLEGIRSHLPHVGVFECRVKDYLQMSQTAKNVCVMYQPEIIQFPAPQNPLSKRISACATDPFAASSIAFQIGEWIASGKYANDTVQAVVETYGMNSTISRVFSSELLTEAIEIRRSLLSGVLSLSGAFNSEKNCVSITVNGNQQLTEQLKHLGRSLGYRMKASADAASVLLSANNLRDLSALSTLPEKLVQLSSTSDVLSSSFSIESGDIGTVHGFTVDGNGQILMSDFLVSHNSANILVAASGGIQLADFGVAGTLIENGDRQKNRKTFTGTPCWMAPEVMENTQGYDSRADIWSLGITALELGFGRAPYSKLHPLKVMVATLQEDPPTADVYNDNSYKFSSNFHEFVRKCLKKERDKRPTASKLLEHKFLRIAKDSHYIFEKLVQKIPPRPKVASTNRPHVGAQKAEEDRQKEQKSKPVSVGSWIFDADSFAQFKAKYGEEVKAEVMTQRAVAATYSHQDTDSDDDKDAQSPTGRRTDAAAAAATTPHHHHESFASAASSGTAPVEEQAGRFTVSEEVAEDGGGAPVFHSPDENAGGAGQHVGRFSVMDEDADA